MWFLDGSTTASSAPCSMRSFASFPGCGCPKLAWSLLRSDFWPGSKLSKSGPLLGTILGGQPCSGPPTCTNIQTRFDFHRFTFWVFWVIPSLHSPLPISTLSPNRVTDNLADPALRVCLIRDSAVQFSGGPLSITSPVARSMMMVFRHDIGSPFDRFPGTRNLSVPLHSITSLSCSSGTIIWNSPNKSSQHGSQISNPGDPRWTFATHGFPSWGPSICRSCNRDIRSPRWPFNWVSLRLWARSIVRRSSWSIMMFFCNKHIGNTRRFLDLALLKNQPCNPRPKNWGVSCSICWYILFRWPWWLNDPWMVSCSWFFPQNCWWRWWYKYPLVVRRLVRFLRNFSIWGSLSFPTSHMSNLASYVPDISSLSSGWSNMHESDGCSRCTCLRWETWWL